MRSGNGGWPTTRSAWAVGLFEEVVGDSAIALEKLYMVAPVASCGRLGKQPSSKLSIMSAAELFRKRILGYASVVLCQIRTEMVEPTGKVNP